MVATKENGIKFFLLFLYTESCCVNHITELSVSVPVKFSDVRVTPVVTNMSVCVLTD